MARKILIGGLAVVLVLGALAYLSRTRIALSLMERQLKKNMASNLLDELPDGLHVALCGAGSPLPDADRSGPCVAIVAGKKLYVVDSGSGSSRNLSRMRLPPARVEDVFITHFHSDHIDGLGELLLQRWVGSAAKSPTPVHGPPGVEEVVEGFGKAYTQDSKYRVAHHGADIVPPSGAGGVGRPFKNPEQGESVVVLEDGDLKVTAFNVGHAPVSPSVGYRFDYKDRSVVVSGDTAKSPNLQKFAEGSDVLMHEALSTELVDILVRSADAAGQKNISKIANDIKDYHATPVEAAEIARDAHVEHLVLYHIVPPLPIAPLQDVFMEGVEETYDGPVTLAKDGVFLSLPAGTDEIEEENLLER